ncbi:GNAT family N-acetyltransferase [Kiloniella sp.]|uniref:GNAT family N-acetyltransferase n=1 Tax=Kiloniella sp. TaxID=1938587 RepID=UPI003B025A1B
MRIRNYTLDDGPVLLKLFHDTVRNINIRDYTQNQVEVWAPGNFDLVRWSNRVKNYKIFVAEDDKGIAGFAELDTNGYIDCFYVHHERQGQGVGKMLIASIEKEALDQNTPLLFADVSITARTFFERFEFTTIQEQEIERKGETLTNFRMEKRL